MRYFVTQIVTANNATAIATHERESIRDAKMEYYQILASAYANPNVTYALVYIDNEFGNREELTHFTASSD